MHFAVSAVSLFIRRQSTVFDSSDLIPFDL